VRNPAAAFSLLVGLLALGVLAAAAYVAESMDEVTWPQAGLAVPLAGILALLALSLSGRAIVLYQRSLGRIGGAGLARVARIIGTIALLCAITAGIAFAVYGVLVWTDGLAETPW
jgi:hypothetical protein